MARISRKELKKDDFVQEVSQTVHYVQEHRSQATLIFAVVGAVLVLGVGGYFLWDKRTSDASDSLSRAQRTFHAQVLPPGAPSNSNEKTFPSDKDKYTAALKEFQAVAGNYSLLRQGAVARYYAALCQIALGNAAQGEKELADVAAGRDEQIGSLARYALAGAQAAAGKNDEAEKNYRYLMEHPTSEVGKTMAEMALASLLRPIKPAEAEKLYREMEAQQVSPKLSEMAKRVLSEMKR